MLTEQSGLVFSGRNFSAEELRLIKEICRDFSGLGRTEISRTVCELLQWRRPNGGLKNHECRLLMERLEQLGEMELPEVRKLGRRGRRDVQLGPSETESELSGTASDLGQLNLKAVTKERADESRLWRELIERHHYLGCRVPVGANLRYLVRSEKYPDRVIACLLWTSPAWKMAVRDRWIGWTDTQRQRNLQLIVNNARFLILPSVRVRGLASKILSLCARHVPADWEVRYGYRPLLLETLVDIQRFRGTCYQSANWTSLGQTQGRGRMDRDHRLHGQSPKQVYVYPLVRNVCKRLQTDRPPVFSGSDED
jgi:hypothetical protein